MEFTDRILKCVNCGEDFVFSAGEQVFFREKQFQHVPRHCKKCNAKHRNARGRVETCVTCSECGASTTVPFLPHLGQPVLCRSCFQWHRRGAPPPVPAVSIQTAETGCVRTCPDRAAGVCR